MIGQRAVHISDDVVGRVESSTTGTARRDRVRPGHRGGGRRAGTGFGDAAHGFPILWGHRRGEVGRCQDRGLAVDLGGVVRLHRQRSRSHCQRAVHISDDVVGRVEGAPGSAAGRDRIRARHRGGGHRASTGLGDAAHGFPILRGHRGGEVGRRQDRGLAVDLGGVIGLDRQRCRGDGQRAVHISDDVVGRVESSTTGTARRDRIRARHCGGGHRTGAGFGDAAHGFPILRGYRRGEVGRCQDRGLTVDLGGVVRLHRQRSRSHCQRAVHISDGVI